MMEFAGNAGQVVTCDCKLEAVQQRQHKFIKVCDHRSKQYVQLRMVYMLLLNVASTLVAFELSIARLVHVGSQD